MAIDVLGSGGTSKDRKQIRGCQWLRVGRWILTRIGHEGTFWSDGNALCLTDGGG